MFLFLRYARTAYLTAAPPPDATHRPIPVPEGVATLGPCYRTIMCSPLGGKNTADGLRYFLNFLDGIDGHTNGKGQNTLRHTLLNCPEVFSSSA